ncbi:MAG: ClpXP protease specificity-enhancing factor [Candidatus Contendobacter odensis]|uniref:ClpXP protease specificity-enhancing factor n=1 Tax=Candidatus Contendibacter odensensis TaxID=1400860 RepID=A0A2G6PFR5_9GAMM|nr:MAG: ClpXP protease specificity-enhancing factor [Candidatus Contendobacter odensis]
MTSTRPYLIRAIYDWIADNAMTPFILVNAKYPDVDVPRQHIHDGQIVLNIAPAAVSGLNLGNDWIEFSARFGGIARNVHVPVAAVLTIYARENGQGMAFGSEFDDHEPPPSKSQKPDDVPTKPHRKPTLKIVK